MNVLELRSDLHNMIDKITDAKTLSAVKTLLSKQSEETKDWWNEIDDDERSEIEQGLSEIEKGDVFSHEHVMAKYQKWLSK